VEFNPFSTDFFDDPYETYAWLRDHAPVYRNDQFGFWALSRYDDVVAAHRDWKVFSSTHGVTIDQLTDPRTVTVDGSIIFLDPPEHERLRRIVSRVFTPKAVADLEPLVRTVVTGYLDGLGTGDDGFDVVADLAAPFPVEVISAILGVPDGDRQQIRHWVDEMLHREPDDPQPTQAGMEAGLNASLYLLELVREKRRRPADDMLSALIEADVPADDGTTYGLDDGAVASFATLLAGAGSETVTKLVGSGVVLFARNPGEWQKVVDDPAKLAGATEEILRYWAPSQYQGRFTRAEVTLHGVTIPESSPVVLLTGAANHDERAYAEPERFDIDRPLQLSVGFGHGIHSCLGAALARLESRVAFEEIRTRWPRYEIDESGLRRVQMANVAGFSNVPFHPS
jgi:cytochrome P450